MLAHTLSFAALESNDNHPPTLELRLARLRAQVAVVRTLADHVEQFARPENAEGLSEQLIEEAARLGCRLFEAAVSMTRAPGPEESGVFARCSADAEGASLDSAPLTLVDMANP
jgi:hypothetical protein